MSIQTEIERLENSKNNLKTSIENKGISIPADAKIDTYSTFVDQIPIGTNNYDELNNLPQINSVTVQGNKTLGDFGIQSYVVSVNQPENQQIGDIWYEEI